jgi:hypothetical protein
MLTEKELRELSEQSGDVCVSLFMPLSQQPDEREANRIRLKNLIKEAEKQLTAVSMKAADLLAPAMELLSNGGLHRQKSAGLAIFMKPDFSRHFFVPATMPELVTVSRRFYIKPLMPLLHDNQPFHILALSQNKVTLFQANHYDVEPVTLPDLPENMAQALWYDDPERQLQYHTSMGKNAAYHGHEVAAEKKGAVLRYFRQINEVVSSRFEEEKSAAAEQYQALAATERASADITEIVPAAHFGRVDTLMRP